MFTTNVSSVNDFMQCRFRWWCKWVMNRVPISVSPALEGGKLLHTIFEDAFLGKDIAIAAKARCDQFASTISQAHPSARPAAERALQQIMDLIEALPMWQDTFKVDEVLEVEAPFLWQDDEACIVWLGRPDRVVRSGSTVWHVQNRGLAAGENFGTYVRLAKRHYHEHLYAEVLSRRYIRYVKNRKKRRLTYGGTIFNLVRKLKYATNVGKKNESRKTAAEMFWQGPLSIDVNSHLHASVMGSLYQHVREMKQTLHRWEAGKEVPAPNEKMNGGFSGSIEDPYFKVLIGEVSLHDDDVFKAREDPYAGIGGAREIASTE